MAEELLETIPPEKRWEITAKILWRFTVLQGDKIFAPELGRGEGIIAPVLGADKWAELTNKVIVDGAKLMIPQIKEMFDIAVEDAIGAVNLIGVTAVLAWGPEFAWEYIEKTPERVVLRITKCPNWEAYEEFDVAPAFRAGCEGHQAFCEEGLKVINPKITYKLTKAKPRGDPYCEDVYEFKDE